MYGNVSELEDTGAQKVRRRGAELKWAASRINRVKARLPEEPGPANEG
jgi:hypothetical protein